VATGGKLRIFAGVELVAVRNYAIITLAMEVKVQNMSFNEEAKAIANERELEFAVFCIESIAEALGRPSSAVYRALTGPGNILNQYVIPSFDVLHTQGKEYIVNDIREVMEERGVSV